MNTKNVVIIDGNEVPVYTVAQLTDRAPAGGWQLPSILSRRFCLTKEEAEDVAREASKTVPKPQRFTVYCPDMIFVSSWQCGERLSAFVVADEP